MTNFIMIVLMSNFFFKLKQMRISEILNQTQYFFDCLASDSVKINKIGNIVARDKFFEGLEKLGVRVHVEERVRTLPGFSLWESTIKQLKCAYSRFSF